MIVQKALLHADAQPILIYSRVGGKKLIYLVWVDGD